MFIRRNCVRKSLALGSKIRRSAASMVTDHDQTTTWFEPPWNQIRAVRTMEKAGSRTLLGAILTGFVGGIVFAGILLYWNPEPIPVAVPVTEAQDRTADLDPAERNTVSIFQRTAPAVVNVAQILRGRVRGRGLFSYNVMEVPKDTGTGFVWDKRGHIVTNYHVLQGADTFQVTFADGTQSRARVVGLYLPKDLAVLRVDLPASKLTPIQVGTSANLLVGQSVLAIGNPFGLDHSLTTGIVSALGREVKSPPVRDQDGMVVEFPIQDVIQMDAAINPGNSGGPLLDSRGRLIGVNTQIATTSGSSAGIGFAIPVDTVKMVVNQLIEHGKVIRAGLGIAPVPPSLSYSSQIVGAVIGVAQEGSAAARAGLQGIEETEDGLRIRDVIVGIDGKKVRSFDDLRLVLESYKVGDEVEVTYTRDGKERRTRVKLQAIQ